MKIKLCRMLNSFSDHYMKMEATKDENGSFLYVQVFIYSHLCFYAHFSLVSNKIKHIKHPLINHICIHYLWYTILIHNATSNLFKFYRIFSRTKHYGMSPQLQHLLSFQYFSINDFNKKKSLSLIRSQQDCLVFHDNCLKNDFAQLLDVQLSTFRPSFYFLRQNKKIYLNQKMSVIKM